MQKDIMNINFIENEKTDWENMGKGIQRKILGYDDQLMMVLVKFEKGAIGFLHKHPHRQVSYIAKGSFETTIDNEKKILKEGDCFFIQPNSEHGVLCLKDGLLIDVFNPCREDFLKT